MKTKLVQTSAGPAYLLDVQFRVHPESIVAALYDKAANFAPTPKVDSGAELVKSFDRAAVFRLMSFHFAEYGYKFNHTLVEPKDEALLELVVRHAHELFPELFTLPT